MFLRVSGNSKRYISTQPKKTKKMDPNLTYPILNRPFLPPPLIAIGTGWVKGGRENREATTEQCCAYFRLQQS